MEYKVVMEKINQERKFNNYREAQKWMTETKRNWEDQINNDFDDPSDESRLLLIELYWSTRIEKVSA